MGRKLVYPCVHHGWKKATFISQAIFYSLYQFAPFSQGHDYAQHKFGKSTQRANGVWQKYWINARFCLKGAFIHDGFKKNLMKHNFMSRLSELTHEFLIQN